MKSTLTNRLTRRELLYAAALLGGASAHLACSPDGSSSANHRPDGGAPDSAHSGRPAPSAARGSATKPLPTPPSLKEPPSVKDLVASGKLPPIEDRAPTNPYVVPHKWLEVGKYGGTLLLLGEAASRTGNIEIYLYGNSPLRWLNDGLDIGPGLVESWESNDEASEWTLNFRKGLKWSDGHPWTTADVTFWWEDLVLNDDAPQTPPDTCLSGNGTLVTMKPIDDFTLKFTFDGPAPLLPDGLASMPNGPGGVGPWWSAPKHYLKQFHPRYNPEIPSDWATAGGVMDTHATFVRNPDCPTMTGWRLKEYREGRSLVWERNPFYWCVDREGNQLPYVDSLVMTLLQDHEVGMVQIRNGKYDYVDGPFFSIDLSQVSSLHRAQNTAGMDVLLWDSGSGTGSCYYLNYDDRDDQRRAVFRDPRFRQALSHGFDRAEMRKSLYYNTGFPTTGTMNPKAIEFQVNDRGKEIFTRWRDSYLTHDPQKAKQLLDAAGVIDVDGDGYRELPSGRKLTILLQHPASAPAVDLHKNNFLIRDWKKIGIKAQDTPVADTSFGDQWSSGKLMSSAWDGCSDGPNCLVFPIWMVPIGTGRWAPLEGQYYAVRGTKAEGTETKIDPFQRTPPRMAPETGGPVEHLWDLYDRSKLEPDAIKRHKLVWEMIKIHIDHGPFFTGCVANYPDVMMIKKDLRNVPRRENLALGGNTQPWVVPCPAVYDPETYFWTNPDKHS